MTTSEIDPSTVDSERAARNENEEAQANPNAETHASPAGNWSPNTPPADATPAGNWSPNTPPSTVVPTGNWSPNTPPNTGSNASAPAQANGNGATQNAGPAGTGVIMQLWSASTVPGVWALVSGVGWKRLAGAEFGQGALIALALLARANGQPVSFREDGQGQIDQLLV